MCQDECIGIAVTALVCLHCVRRVLLMNHTHLPRSLCSGVIRPTAHLSVIFILKDPQLVVKCIGFSSVTTPAYIVIVFSAGTECTEQLPQTTILLHSGLV